MKIIVPMSGFGERFRRAGFTVPKPLIEVEGKPIIAHVIDLFPGEEDFVFICNQEHLNTTPMAAVLNQYCPTGKVVSIHPHKQGPVYAISQAYDLIDDDTPTIVNYCDFTCYWDYTHFKQWIKDSKSDGCVPAYRGFHPHSLGSTNYAFMRVEANRMLEIQEKQPFTNNKIDEFASSGTYYFSKGRYVKKFFSQMIDADIQTNGEYYCSMAYNLMVEAGLFVSVYELEHFMQWGTPQDLAEYQRWSDAFRDLIKTTSLPRINDAERTASTIPGTTIIPMAGRGSRFKVEGYSTEKPLIPISGKPMVVQAANSLPKTESYKFVCLKEHAERSEILSILNQQFPRSTVTILDSVTDGQARTCLTALEGIEPDSHLTISACDHGVIFSTEQYMKMLNDPSIDCIVWVTRGHLGASKYPKMYGWIETDKGDKNIVTRVSVKQPLDNPATDPIVIGTFTFKTVDIFRLSAQRMIERDGRVNGEFYVDTCIEDAIALGYRCVIFEVEHYFCWGTPNDLKTFEYWQSCFHKWPSHDYRRESDIWKSHKKSDILSPSPRVLQKI
ncbi:MAG: NTP transferase domain-containing protein [Cyanobacteria bacterium P01_D01_bin.105]